MSKIITFDARIISDLKALTDDSSCATLFTEDTNLFEISLRIIEGRKQSSIQEIFQQTSIGAFSSEQYLALCKATGTLFWEAGKNASKDASTLEGILLQLGLAEHYVVPFCAAFRANRRRIVALKSVLDLSIHRYQNLEWRLDIELARRNSTTVTEPKFQLRLDVSTIDSSSTESPLPSNSFAVSVSETCTSHHLQADYANMKNLQVQLQKALDELGGVHSQRMMRYIS